MSKILLVEDNPDAVKRIIRYINKIFAELDVVSFPEAGDALQYAKANDISLFILDIQLEDYKGTNLAKQLRELPEYKYTPIIFEKTSKNSDMTWQRYKLNLRNSLLLEEYFRVMEQFDSILSSVIDSTLRISLLIG